jgi:DegV family protein with EDD domain
MSNVRIVTDSACDLTLAQSDAAGIGVVPLNIRFGDEEFVDREQLDPDTFYRRMADFEGLPETSAPSPGRFEQEFRSMAADGASAVVCIDLSFELSATGQSAKAAADAMADELDVRVVDSRSITAGLGTITLLAAEAAAAGASADEVVALVEDLRDRTRVYGVLDTLENLKKGGRVGGAKALVGSMLAIKPLLDLSTGVVEEAGRQRTRKKALGWLRDKIAEAPDAENFAIVHAAATDIDEFVASLGDLIDTDAVRMGMIGPVIGTHGGQGIVGIAYTVPRAG